MQVSQSAGPEGELRWRQEFGGLKMDQVKRMKELEAENARLRRAAPI